MLKGFFVALTGALMLAMAGCAESDGPVIELAPELTYSTTTDDEGKADRIDCSLVLCLAVECPVGFKRKFTPRNCCGTCVRDPKAVEPAPEGTCTTVDQCADLVHIMCVGSWSCENGFCSYSCF